MCLVLCGIVPFLTQVSYSSSLACVDLSLATFLHLYYARGEKESGIDQHLGDGHGNT